MLDLSTPDRTRQFLALCLDPGLGRKTRTLTELADVIPPWLADKVDVHAPHLAQLRTEADRLRADAAAAQAAYTTALGAWIDAAAGDPAPEAPSTDSTP
ncbi:hypothetical protein [Streptomyces anulatus]|uniref:hypothetical protein n=1 Tax=Streptomyces anulatus TaxID=1892 RepID=UPI0036835A27